MDFRDYAANETSALIARLVATQTEVSSLQLRTLRDALDAAARALENPPAVDKDVQELVTRLNNAVTNAARRIREDARVAHDATRAELEEARAQLDAVRAELAIACEDLDSERRDRDRIAASLPELESQVDALRGDLRALSLRAESAERELTEARVAHDAIEAQLREVEDARRRDVDVRASLEEDLKDTRGLLDAAVAEAAQLGGELEAETARRNTLQRELSDVRDAHSALESLYATAKDATAHETLARHVVEDELRDARVARDEAMSELAHLREQMTGATAEIVSLKSELSAARQAYDDSHGARVRAEAWAAEEVASRNTAENELTEVRVSLDSALAEVAHLGVELETHAVEKGRLLMELSAAQTDLQTAQAQRDAVVAQLKASQTRVQTLERNQAKQTNARDEADRLRTEVDALVSLLKQAAGSVDALVQASTMSDLFAALVHQLAGQFSRAALFRVKSNRLEGEHQVGFDATTDVTKLALPLSLDSFLTRCVTSNAIEQVTGDQLAENGGTPFGGTPAFAVALPLSLHGEPLAVLYADIMENADGPAERSHDAAALFATLMVRQATVLLMRLTHEIKTLGELRDYAIMLLQEAEHMHTADADAGKAEGEIRARLRDNLDCARQLFAQRASLEGTAAAALLDDEIAAVIDAASNARFAADLAAVVGHVSDRRASQAS